MSKFRSRSNLRDTVDLRSSDLAIARSRHTFTTMRTLIILTFAILLSISTWVIAPNALAVTPIQLSDVSYKDCPPEIAAGSVTSGGVTQDARCFLIVGKAENKSNKTVYDADVYGRIYDADNNNVLPNRGRVGTLDRILPGISDFEVRIAVAADITTPLQLKKFKASGFTTKIRQ
jgi:hypothetical protein